MSLLHRVKSLGNPAHAIHGPRHPRQPNPVKAGKRMASHVQTRHDDNPFGLHAAQLANAKTAIASGTPYNPRAGRKKLPAKPKGINDGISVLSKRYKR